LLIGRFDSVIAVSNAMKRINQEDARVELDIYSGSYISQEDKQALSEHVHLKGVTSQENVLHLQKQADVLLFAEAMSGENSQIARLSFSTKLTDYFCSGKCILAVGAKDVAPMEYLASEQAALCASTEEEIYLQLKKLTEDPALIGKIAENAYRCGQNKHSREKIDDIIKRTFAKILPI
jgi:hypothetical protein